MACKVIDMMFWRLTFPGFLYLSAAIGPFSDNPYFFENNDERIEDHINEMLRRRQVVNHLEKYIPQGRATWEFTISGLDIPFKMRENSNTEMFRLNAKNRMGDIGLDIKIYSDDGLAVPAVAV